MKLCQSLVQLLCKSANQTRTLRLVSLDGSRTRHGKAGGEWIQLPMARIKSQSSCCYSKHWKICNTEPQCWLCLFRGLAAGLTAVTPWGGICDYRLRCIPWESMKGKSRTKGQACPRQAAVFSVYKRHHFSPELLCFQTGTFKT